MTVEKNAAWGAPAPRPAGLTVAAGDAELADLVARDADGDYGINGGDLFRSLGAPAPRDPSQHLPCDALRVVLDDREVLAVANVVARHHWLSGPIVIVSNCGHLGSWNVAPRAHPNDGRFDVVEVSPTMSMRQRLHARRRLPSGNHVPHPGLTVRQAASAEWTFQRPLDVEVDGVGRGRCSRLTVAIVPDHFSIYI